MPFFLGQTLQKVESQCERNSREVVNKMALCFREARHCHKDGTVTVRQWCSTATMSITTAG